MNEKLTAYALNELPPDERAALEAQMKNDPSLRQEAEEMKAFCQMLDKEIHTGVDDTLKPEQRSRLVQTFQGSERKIIRPLWRRPAVLSSLGLAAAACIALMFTLHEVKDHLASSPVDADRIAPQAAEPAAKALMEAAQPSENVHVTPATPPLVAKKKALRDPMVMAPESSPHLAPFSPPPTSPSTPGPSAVADSTRLARDRAMTLHESQKRLSAASDVRADRDPAAAGLPDGSSTLTLGATNSYSGATIVSSGTHSVNGGVSPPAGAGTYASNSTLSAAAAGDRNNSGPSGDTFKSRATVVEETLKNVSRPAKNPAPSFAGGAVSSMKSADETSPLGASTIDLNGRIAGSGNITFSGNTSGTTLVTPATKLAVAINSLAPAGPDSNPVPDGLAPPAPTPTFGLGNEPAKNSPFYAHSYSDFDDANSALGITLQPDPAQMAGGLLPKQDLDRLAHDYKFHDSSIPLAPDAASGVVLNNGIGRAPAPSVDALPAQGLALNGGALSQPPAAGAPVTIVKSGAGTLLLAGTSSMSGSVGATPAPEIPSTGSFGKIPSTTTAAGSGISTGGLVITTPTGTGSTAEFAKPGQKPKVREERDDFMPIPLKEPELPTRPVALGENKLSPPAANTTSLIIASANAPAAPPSSPAAGGASQAADPTSHEVPMLGDVPVMARLFQTSIPAEQTAVLEKLVQEKEQLGRQIQAESATPPSSAPSAGKGDKTDQKIAQMKELEGRIVALNDLAKSNATASTIVIGQALPGASGLRKLEITGDFGAYRTLMDQADELKKQAAGLPENTEERTAKDNELRGKYQQLRAFEKKLAWVRQRAERERMLTLEAGRLRIIAEQREAEERARQQAASTATYRPIVENPFTLVARQPLSTFSTDVDTASYANVRRFLNSGQRPPADAVRLEEMINYFPYSYAPPKDDRPIAVKVDFGDAPWQPLHRLARIAIKAREVKQEERQAASFTFLLDVSGSMSPPERLPMVKQALRLLVEQLREDDRVSIVTYAGHSGVALESTAGDRKETILEAIDNLHAGGSTNGAGGIRLAYEQALSHFRKGGVNRVILCTDGDFNVGTSNVRELEQLIAEKAKTGVFLSVLGVGTDNLHDHTMQTLADRGNGNYHYLDSMSEARKVLVEQMTGTLITVAKDVKIQIEFNPTQVAAYRLIGYEKRMLAKEDFNNDRKDAGEIGAGHTITALYEIVPANLKYPDGNPVVDALKYDKPGDVAAAPSPEPKAPAAAAAAPKAETRAPSRESMTVKLRYKAPNEDKSSLIQIPVTDAQKKLGDNDHDFQFAASVAGFGMLLRDSPYGSELNWNSVREMALAGKGKDEQGWRGEFIQLIEKARGICGDMR